MMDVCYISSIRFHRSIGKCVFLLIEIVYVMCYNVVSSKLGALLMSIYRIAKENIDKSKYKTESSLQRAILNYINNCLSNFGGSIDAFKCKDAINEFIINSTLETIIKNYITNKKSFPYVNHFEEWRLHPEWYQSRVDETIIVVKNFLDYNFKDETFKKQRELIKENMEKARQIIERVNKQNLHYQNNILSNISTFISMIIMDDQKLEEYFAIVHCAYNSLSYDEHPKFNMHEKIILEFVQYSNNLSKLIESFMSEYTLNYCSDECI